MEARGVFGGSVDHIVLRKVAVSRDYNLDSIRRSCNRKARNWKLNKVANQLSTLVMLNNRLTRWVIYYRRLDQN